MAEIEIGVLGSQCLARRIPTQAQLGVQVEAWTEARNQAGARIKWMFDIEAARHYPVPAFSSTQALAVAAA